MDILPIVFRIPASVDLNPLSNKGSANARKTEYFHPWSFWRVRDRDSAPNNRESLSNSETVAYAYAVSTGKPETNPALDSEPFNHYFTAGEVGNPRHEQW